MKRIELFRLPLGKILPLLERAARRPAEVNKTWGNESTISWSETEIEINNKVRVDYEDLWIPSNHQAINQITRILTPIHNDDWVPAWPGGNHFITHLLAPGLCKFFPGLHIFHFDAHPDLYEEFAGNRYSHACPFARILEQVHRVQHI